MAELSTKKEAEAALAELTKVIALMSPTQMVCLKCKTIYNNDHRLCYCDFESDRYGVEQ